MNKNDVIDAFNALRELIQKHPHILDETDVVEDEINKDPIELLKEAELKARGPSVYHSEC